MTLAKKYLKLIIGIAALILVAIIFVITLKSSGLENGDLRDWRSASESRRTAAVKILDGSEANVQVLSDCISRMSDLPDSSRVKVRDAAALCSIGIALKDNM